MQTRKRGRKSEAELAIVTTLPERPRPPASLHDEEAAIWSQVVGSHPGGWLAREAFPLLIQYCRHSVRSDRVARAIHNYENEDHGEEGFDIDYYQQMLAIQEKETRSILACARSLRISHQARYRADAPGARPEEQRVKPWNL